MASITFFDLSDDEVDRMAAQVIRSRIEALQLLIDVNANFAVEGGLSDDIQALFHLMHAYNYLTPPTEHYDVPTP